MIKYDFSNWTKDDFIHEIHRLNGLIDQCKNRSDEEQKGWADSIDRQFILAMCRKANGEE